MCYSGREMVVKQIAHFKKQNNTYLIRIMLVSFQSPVAGAIGKLEHDGKFYIRRMYGKYILQRCPNRRGHVATPAEKENQQRFIQQYRRLRRGDGSQASGSVTDGRGSGLEVKDKEV